MPTRTFSSLVQDNFDAIDLEFFSAAKPRPNSADVNYEFIYWIPSFWLRTIPPTISRKLKDYGDKYYLGEVAFLNFGEVVKTEYLSFERQQSELCLALPLPLFESYDEQNEYATTNYIFQPGAIRARSLKWDVESGVEFDLNIRYLKSAFVYRPGISNVTVM